MDIDCLQEGRMRAFHCDDFGRGFLRPGAIPAVLLLAATALAGEPAKIAGALGARMDRAVQLETGGGFWGAILVARKGEVLLAKGYGFADYANRPNRPDTLFEIASTSKPFTAAGILKLESEGKLKIDDALPRYFKGVPDDKKKITLRHLLTHTSGIDPNTGLPYASPASREAFVRHVMKARVLSKPGERFAYFNSGYALLAAVIEIASKQPFETYMKEKIFGPAGLKDTGFVRDPDLDASRASGRLSDGALDGTCVAWHWSWGYRGMGGVVTTVEDLLAWDRALRAGKVLGEAARQKYYEPAENGYALGWMVGPGPDGTRKAHHAGGVAGFVCNWVRYLEKDAMIAILSNGKSDVHALTRVLEDLLFPRPKVELIVDVSPFELTKYKAVQFDGTADWVVTRKGSLVLLALRHREKKHDAAVVRLPRGEAVRFRALLDQILRQKGATGWGEEDAMEAGVYLYPYAPKAGRLTLSGDLRFEVRPGYVGTGEGGEEIRDARLLLVLNDVKRRMWPIMAHVDRGTAEKLLADLDGALK
jgi:CubicO group peptidase (beta-lactamase class C family)